MILTFIIKTSFIKKNFMGIYLMTAKFIDSKYRESGVHRGLSILYQVTWNLNFHFQVFKNFKLLKVDPLV